MKNYYSLPSGYLEDPFNSIKSDPYGEYVSEDSELRQLWDYAYDLSETLSKEFNLNAIASQMKEKFLSFVEIGLLAFKVKSYCLWKQDKRLKGFKDFCVKILGRPTWQVNDLIKGANVMMKLIGLGFSINELPRSLSQALEISKVPDNELYHVWKRCLEAFPIYQMSAEKIKGIVNPESGSNGSIKLPKKLIEKLREKARQSGLSIEDLLEDLLEDDENETEEIPDSDLEVWEEDLSNLIEESDSPITVSNIDYDDDEPRYQCGMCGSWFSSGISRDTHACGG